MNRYTPPKNEKTKNEELAFSNCEIIIYIIIYNIIIYIKKLILIKV